MTPPVPAVIALAFGQTLQVEPSIVKVLWQRISPWLTTAQRYYLHQAERDWSPAHVEAALRKLEPAMIFQALQECYPERRGQVRNAGVRRLEAQLLHMMNATGEWVK